MKKVNAGSWILAKETNEIEKFIMEGGKTVCEVYESFPPEKVWSNANLIASAPDLLEALEKTVSDLFYQISGRHGERAAYNYPSIVNARAAIAKAKGEAK